jgi:hypothetical protein
MSLDVTEVPSTRNSDICYDVVPRRYIRQRSRNLVANGLTEEVENKTHKTKKTLALQSVTQKFLVWPRPLTLSRTQIVFTYATSAGKELAASTTRGLTDGELESGVRSRWATARRSFATDS